MIEELWSLRDLGEHYVAWTSTCEACMELGHALLSPRAFECVQIVKDGISLL